ncbi:hypothetical protein LMH87_006824 [Akanthomyces muscarius]|uniref:Uncharacterized protein n=1 Tax=Akanthomyces muscarius TaxID=2231603 RepID=A0A9W8QNI7_AKAMU|nr:hypothetical protein LMH87_006824 [Akanthomyces muscarius]KAJ4165181.1 hypothetical protein LMH87_006824 [Akanthomyces muscarius]
MTQNSQLVIAPLHSTAPVRLELTRNYVSADPTLQDAGVIPSIRKAPASSISLARYGIRNNMRHKQVKRDEKSADSRSDTGRGEAFVCPAR